ncbi:unnamed protein product, partial [Effrenium voratum]
AIEKEKSHVELGGSRQSQEHTSKIRNLRSMSKQLSFQLEASEQRIESLESTSESHVNNLASSEAAAQQHRELLEERAQAAESWGQELAKRLQSAEERHQQLHQEREVHHKRSQGHLAEAQDFSLRLMHAVERQVAEILAMAGAPEAPGLFERRAEGEPPEVLATRAFTVVSKAVAGLVRETLGGVGSESREMGM